MNPTIKILCVNEAGERVAAASAKLSTSEGGVLSAFESANEADKNRRLIAKVLSSGHASVLEHITLNLAVCASVAVEQFFIEFRLASFTVKSRRYVNFAEVGHYTPPDLEGGVSERYEALYKQAFELYADLCAGGVPREDARFVLPYGFQSDFFVTLNARELLLVLSRMGDTAELCLLREQLLSELKTACPAVLAAYKPAPPRPAPPPPYHSNGEKAELLQAPYDPENLLAAAGCWDAAALADDPRPRALEHLAYTFRLNGLSLAGLTHLARHRMQSLSVPPVASVSAARYIKPSGVPEALAGRYAAVFAASAALLAELPGEYRQYAALSGHTVDAVTTMNARELLLFLRLRLCCRAQWEIRGFAKAMLELLRDNYPRLFNRVGPSCFLLGKCPEGRMTCGRFDEMQREYAP